jgi:hypothetical protein
VSQRGVAEACNVSEVSIRNSYRNLIKVLGLEGRLLVKIEPTPELRDVGVKPYYYPKIPGGYGSAKKERINEAR